MRQNYSALEIYEDFLGLLFILRKMKNDIVVPRDLTHGLNTMNLFYVWMLVLETKQYPLLFKKLFSKIISREANEFGVFMELTKMEAICDGLHFFLFKEREQTGNIIKATLSLMTSVEQDEEVSIRFKEEIVLLLNHFNSDKSNFIDDDNRGSIVSPESKYVKQYAQYVQITREKTLPKLLSFIESLKVYFDRYTVCDSDTVEVFETEIPMYRGVQFENPICDN